MYITGIRGMLIYVIYTHIHLISLNGGFEYTRIYEDKKAESG